LIPANPALYGEASDRHTLCISTQVGCAYGCKFCASGLDGWKRNLTPDEIVEQVLAVERGMSDEALVLVLKAKNRLAGTRTAHEAIDQQHRRHGHGRAAGELRQFAEGAENPECAVGRRHWRAKITISTSGLAPQIRRLAEEPMQFRLAISLHGATDETRNKIMPVNRKYPLKELIAACEEYQHEKGRMITLEYILIAGVNDSIEQTKAARALAHRLSPR
jgi:23S rRNA (adenine2503-C2)-methyltransferase